MRRRRRFWTAAGACRAPERRQATGSSRVGASTVPGQYLLPDFMSGFLGQFPQSQYVVLRGDSAQIHQFLAQARVRIGFVGAAMDRQNCVYHAIAEDRLVLITANREPYRSLCAQKVPGRTLLDRPFILRSPPPVPGRRWRITCAAADSPGKSFTRWRKSTIRRPLSPASAGALGSPLFPSFPSGRNSAGGKLLSFDPGCRGRVPGESI